MDKTGNMQRPVMNPNFLQEKGSGPRERYRILKIFGRLLWRLVHLVWRVVTYDPLRRKLRIEDGGAVTRFLRGLGYRLMFAPVLLAGIVCLMVYSATHPKVDVIEANPSSLELYFEPLTFLTSDNVRLEGSLYPVLDAREVILEQEKVLRKRYPAVLLVHDFGMRKDQMLPLVRPLHESGFVVMTMNLRGNGGSGPAAQTFGLREALDVKAAVELLRRRSFVDAARVSVVGAGTGATATLIHAKKDKAIAAMVLTDPLKSVDALLDGTLAPRHPYLKWMRPICKWTFEFAYQLDVDDVAWYEFDYVLQTRPVLIIGTEGGHTDFSRPKHIEEIRSFLATRILTPKMPMAKTN